MSIVGCIVYSKRFGKGRVEKCENNIITVKFNDKNCGEFQTNFIFPSAFSNGFLTSSDERIPQYIKQTTIEQTCTSCGRTNLQTELIDGNRFCETCEKQKTSRCIFCGEVHDRRFFTLINTKVHPYMVSMCKNCIPNHTFICDECGNQYTNENRFPCSGGQSLCTSCYQMLVEECALCGSQCLREECEIFFRNEEPILVCPDCRKHHTFICSKCGREELIESLVDSKYIPAAKRICKECAFICSSCGEATEWENSVCSFGRHYCTKCWETKKRNCPICNEVFVPNVETQSLCFDCADSEIYIHSLERIDFSSRKAKLMTTYDLENVNRCYLFTCLLDNCRFRENRMLPQNGREAFHYIIFRFLGYDAVVTYIPRSIMLNVCCSANVTMTEFRSNRGKQKVSNAITRWLSKSNHKISLPEGDMLVLNYPVLLRVQTEYDKNYGKEWNGPDDYIEIGNYGDTTNFYLIGVLEKSQKGLSSCAPIPSQFHMMHP